MTDKTAGPGWIGPAPSLTQAMAVMTVGVMGVMIAGLQPLLLGALAQEGRLTAAQIGHAATAELLTMGLAAGMAGAWLKAERLKLIALVSGLVLALLNVATLKTTGEMITLVRAAAGVPSGLMIWVTIGMVSRAPRPERWSGIYLTVQTLAQFLLAAALTAWVVGRWGANGGFLALAAVSAFCGLAGLAGPDRYAPLAHEDGVEAKGIPVAGWVSLTAAFLFLAFIVGVWVYAEPLSRQAGHPPSVAGTAVSLSLACQVLGGAAATVFAHRIRWFWALIGCAILDFGLLFLFANLPKPELYLAATGLFGFLWLFVLPFLAPMAIEADPSRRSAVLLGGAQLLGGSLGPLMASALVTDTDARGALGFGAAALAVSVAIAIGLHLQHAKR
jgi:hypothetical protein